MECVICLNSKIQTTYLCGHSCACIECAKKNGNKCPMCRKECSWIRLFFSDRDNSSASEDISAKDISQLERELKTQENDQYETRNTVRQNLYPEFVRGETRLNYLTEEQIRELCIEAVRRAERLNYDDEEFRELLQESVRREIRLNYLVREQIRELCIEALRSNRQDIFTKFNYEFDINEINQINDIYLIR